MCLGAVLAALGVVLGHLGAVLGQSWGGLGRSWAALGLLLVALGRSWAALGRSWGGLGASLGRSWAALGRSWAILGPSAAILNRLGVALGCIWGRFEFGLDLNGFFMFFGIVWEVVRRHVPQVSQTFFLRHEFVERRPSEDLTSSLPLSALPVLAKTGLS